MQVTGGSSAAGPRRGAAAVASLAACLGVVALPGIGLEVGEAQAVACKGARANPGKVKPATASHAVVCLINRRRQSRGLRAVKQIKPLRAAAKRHSRYMLRTRCFAHRCPGEKELAGRISDTAFLPCGCRWGLGETIAAAQGRRAKPRRIVRSWMRSPGHRQVLTNPTFTRVGVGVVWGVPWAPNRSSAGTYTADFGFKL